MANSVDPDQTAPEGAVWSGSTPFACAISLETLVYEILGHLPYMYYTHVKQIFPLLHDVTIAGVACARKV